MWVDVLVSMMAAKPAVVVASNHREVLACASFVAVENDVFHSFSNPTESMEKTDEIEQSVTL